MIEYVILFLWFVSALFDYSEYSYLWQLKEYLWRRFRDFLSSEQGRAYWRSYRFLGRTALALFFFAVPVAPVQYGVAVYFLADLVYHTAVFYHKRFRHPKPTKSVIIIIACALLLETTLFFFIRNDRTVFLLVPFRFALISAVIALLTVPRHMVTVVTMKLARRKMARYPRLLVVGITGSFGKSTVKEFLSQMLSQKFTVVKTPKNINSDDGISRFILRTDFSRADIFVMEVGAYNRGHIASVCRMVRPSVGILTAINEQHLALFGSIEATQAAKYELLRSLSADGLAVTSSDNPYCREYLHELTSAVATYGVDPAYHPACRIIEARQHASVLHAAFQIKEDVYRVKLPLIGAHFAQNIAPCILVARHLGMEQADIEAAAATVSLPGHGLTAYQYGNAHILDDSYSSNPEGFKAALRLLASYPHQKRIVITRGMIELGERSSIIHKEIGKYIAETADELVIITPDAAEELSEGAREGNLHRVLRRYDPEELLRYLRSLQEANAAILIENRVPKIISEELARFRPGHV